MEMFKILPFYDQVLRKFIKHGLLSSWHTDACYSLVERKKGRVLLLQLLACQTSDAVTIECRCTTVVTFYTTSAHRFIFITPQNTPPY